MTVPTITLPPILHIIDSLAPGGAERMLVDIANATYVDGYKVGVCVTRSAIDLAPALAPAIPLYILHRKGRFDLAGLWRFAKIVWGGGYKILHIHGRSSFSFCVVVKLLAILPMSVKLVLHDHYGIDDAVPKWMPFAAPLFLNQYVSVFPRPEQWLKRFGISPHRATIIGNAIDFKRFRSVPAPNKIALRQRYQLSVEIPIGACVCSIRPVKGLEVLINALAQQTNPFHFLLIGPEADPTYAQQCRDLIQSLGVQDTVQLMGAQLNIPAILAECDFAILSSYSESGPLVVIEYMAMGLPFVSTQVGEISQRAMAAGATAFVAPGNVEQMATEIKTLLELSPPARRLRGQAGKTIAEQHFEIHQTMPQWYTIYQALAVHT